MNNTFLALTLLAVLNTSYVFFRVTGILAKSGPPQWAQTFTWRTLFSFVAMIISFWLGVVCVVLAAHMNEHISA